MSVWQWVWRSDALAQARAAQQAIAPDARAAIERAELALELGDRLIDPSDPLRASGVALALSAYREAAHWALCACSSAQTPATDTTRAFAGVPEPLLLHAAGDDAAELARVREALCDKTFVSSASDVPAVIERDARSLAAFARALVTRTAGAERAEARALGQRWARSLAAACVLGVLAFGAQAAIGRATAQPDLAKHKKWRLSSKFADCEPENMRCGGKRTAIFFHTLEQDDPWYEVDLGTPTRFSAIEVDNRSDCCPDRAIPLVLEVSDNQRVWKKIARRDDPFRSFRAEFSPVTARYVRARVARRSLLHLERFAVFR